MDTDKNTLLVIGDPYWPMSIYNKIIVEDLQKSIPGLTVSNLYEQYPDYKIDVEAEQQKLTAADNIIIQGPLYWYSLPSLTMRWVEEVFTHGWAYGSEGTALTGKKVVVGITAGAAKHNYTDGRFPITENDIASRFHATFDLCRMDYKGVLFNGGFMNMGNGIADPAMVEAAHRHAAEIIKRLQA